MSATMSQLNDMDVLQVRAQPGPQTAYLSSPADIAIYGGAAGAGKTFATLIEPLRWTWVPDFAAVIFRRTTTQIRNPGGLWNESTSLYAPLQSRAVQQPLEHRFESGAVVKFASLEHEDSVYDWDGSQIPLIAFDQLEHFSYKQFFYMLSRNRSTCGVTPYIRATCNPDPDSWLATFISWWIDQETGFPINERAGKIRWFVRIDDVMEWADTKEELEARFGADCMPKSVTFVPGTIYDNKQLLSKNPQYLANLKALQRVERERLLGGNWKIKAAAGLMFRREWCKFLEVEPQDVVWTRYWDLAATEKNDSNDPDWTVGVKLGKYKTSKRYVIGHVIRMRESAHKVDEAMVNTAGSDGKRCRVGLPQDPGQAGKAQVAAKTTVLAGFSVRAKIESGDKVTRFGPFSAQCEAGNVDIVIGPWNDDFLRSLESFPDGKHKDDADACSGALEMHTGARGMAIYDMVREEVETKAKAEEARRIERAGGQAPAPVEQKREGVTGFSQHGTPQPGMNGDTSHLNGSGSRKFMERMG